MADRPDDKRLARYYPGASGMDRDDDAGDWVRYADVEALLERINMLACYASEEDTSAQPAVLLEIGKLARQEMKP